MKQKHMIYRIFPFIFAYGLWLFFYLAGGEATSLSVGVAFTVEATVAAFLIVIYLMLFPPEKWRESECTKKNTSIVAFVFVVAVGVMMVLFVWKKVKTDSGFMIYWDVDGQFAEEVSEEGGYSAEFAAPKNMQLSGVMIELTGTPSEGTKLTAKLTDLVTNEMIASTTMPLSVSYNYEWVKIDFASVPVQYGENLRLTVECDGGSSSEKLFVMKAGDQTSLALKISGSITDSFQKMSMVTMILLLVIALMGFALLSWTSVQPRMLFLPMFLVSRVLWLLTIPGFWGGDQIAGFYTPHSKHVYYERYYSMMKLGLTDPATWKNLLPHLCVIAAVAVVFFLVSHWKPAAVSLLFVLALIPPFWVRELALPRFLLLLFLPVLACAGVSAAKRDDTLEKQTITMTLLLQLPLMAAFYLGIG